MSSGLLGNIGPFCRNGFSPKHEPAQHGINKTGRFLRISYSQVAASREILLGSPDLLVQLTDDQMSRSLLFERGAIFSMENRPKVLQNPELMLSIVFP